MVSLTRCFNAQISVTPEVPGRSKNIWCYLDCWGKVHRHHTPDVWGIILSCFWEGERYENPRTKLRFGLFAKPNWTRFWKIILSHNVHLQSRHNPLGNYHCQSDITTVLATSFSDWHREHTLKACQPRLVSAEGWMSRGLGWIAHDIAVSCSFHAVNWHR
jgi:hypothetical protein